MTHGTTPAEILLIVLRATVEHHPDLLEPLRRAVQPILSEATNREIMAANAACRDEADKFLK